MALLDRLHADFIESDALSSIVQSLINYGTSKTVNAVADRIQTADAGAVFASAGGLKVLSALAGRVDVDGKSKSAVLKKSAGLLKPQTVAENPAQLAFVAELVKDDEFAKPVAKILGNASSRTAWRSLLCDKSANPNVLALVDKLIRNAARAGSDASSAVCSCVMGWIEHQLTPKAAHRPRPALLLALAEEGPVDATAKLAESVGKWDNLPQAVAGSNGKALAGLIRRAPEPQARLLGRAIVDAVGVKTLSTRSMGSATIVVAMRERGFLDESADQALVDLVDAAEDGVHTASASCSISSRMAAARGIDRLERAGKLAAAARRPRVAVADDDDSA